LTSISADLPACSADTASFVANLQDQIAKKLDEIAPVGCTTLGHDVRLFCGHNGPELTWPELALLPHQPNQPNQPYLPPAESQTALARLASGSVLVAVRSDVGSQALTRFRTHCGTLCGLWIVDCGLWIVECGLWIVDCGLWIVWIRIHADQSFVLLCSFWQSRDGRDETLLQRQPR
jgi:hypothetical protein